MKFRTSSQLHLFFLFVIFVTSFAGTSQPVSASVIPSARPSTEKILEQLGGYPCPNESYFTCVTIDVPLDHFNPSDTRKLAVTFAVLPASGNRKGMFVVATGGPGTAGVSLADYYTNGYSPRLWRRFDIVFFDQRGVGLSGGLTCPEAAHVYYQRDGRSATPAQKAALAESAKTFSDNCVQEMGNPDILPYLGTEQAVEDLEIFRNLMQDEKFWLYGESYGTQYAQTYTAKYGEHLNGLILDGVVDLTLDGFEYYAQEAEGFNDTLTATLEVCNGDPACLHDIGSNILKYYPDLEEISDNTVEAYDYATGLLEGAPDTYSFPLPQGGFADREFTFADYETVSAAQLYTEADRMMLNRALASSAAYDNLVPMARLLYLAQGVDPETLEIIPDPSYSDAIFFAVECQDYGYPGNTEEEKLANFFEAGDKIVPNIPRLGSIFYGDLPCVYWPDATTDLSRPAPLVAEGIPTLVLGATADPATPVSNAHRVYERLDDGYLITQEGGPHVIYGWGNPCPDDIVNNFLLRGEVPAQKETVCPGVVADEYVPISPINAAEFADLTEAFGWFETEITYLPEYYYWDGYTPSSAGCTLGGTFDYRYNGIRNVFSFDQCAFAEGFSVSGRGGYNYDLDRFSLNVTIEGRWQCNARYVRTGPDIVLTGTCDGNPLRLQGQFPLEFGNRLLLHPGVNNLSKGR